MTPKLIEAHLIDEPQRPLRTDIPGDYIEKLAKSIADIGLINRVTVKPVDGGRYEVVAGHCRFLACRLMGMTKVPCDVVTHGKDQEATMLAENITRLELSPADECMFLAELYSKLDDVEKVAAAVRESEDYVGSRIALFVDGDPRVFAQLKAGTIVFGQAVALNKCEDEDMRNLYLTSAVSSGATIRQLREWIQGANQRLEMARQEAAAAAAPGEAPPVPSTTLPPGPGYVHQADPREFSSSKEHRDCKLCGEVMEEWKMFAIRVCEPCSGSVLQPLLQGLKDQGVLR